MDKFQSSTIMSVPSLVDQIAHLTAAAEESRELVVSALREEMAELRRQLARHRGNSSHSGYAGTTRVPVARWAQLLRELHGVALATGTVENLCRSMAAEANRQRPTVRLVG
jgi:hypothetical protein